MNESMQKVIAFLRGHWVVVAVLVGGLVAGHTLGYWLHPRIVTKTETREVVKWQDKVQTVTVEKPVVRYRDRTVTITKPGETIVIHDQNTIKSGGSETRTDTTGTGTTAVSNSSSTFQAPEGRWSVRVLTGISGSGGVVVGTGVDYRLLGPITVGLWGSAPMNDLKGAQGGVAVGLRL